MGFLISNEKLVRFSFFDIHFSEVSSFSFFDIQFQKLVCFSFFDIRFSEVSLFFVFRHSDSDFFLSYHAHKSSLAC